ncbi:GUT2 [Sanghuangporus weigelae]
MAPLSRIASRRAFAYVWVAAAATSAVGGYIYLNSGPSYPPSTTRNQQSRRPPPLWTPPTRKEMLDRLKRSSNTPEQQFDLLIVGGGATGAGVAVDAATRGLKVALVERDDFSSGTSSKSTKLVHGGVRYLQKAVMELDYEQYKLVKEALHERRIFLQTAPYLSHMLPIMLPVYKYWQVPYYWAGCKLYDVLAGKENMESSYMMSKGKALEAFPMLKHEGLVGAIVYYDGQHNDSRMNMALIMTAVRHGATVANHVEVTQLDKDPDTGKLKGAVVRDTLTGKSWPIRARGIVNATGPFSDSILTLDNPSHQPIVQPAAGVHITLPSYYAPRNMGLLDPATSDGRVIFFLPWQGSTIAGTTDSPSAIEYEPKPREEDIDWVLDEVRHYLSPDIKVRRGDVLSAWSGIRPLVRNPNAARTEGLVRNHIVHVSPSGLLTIAGGKWTTYRKMAEETVDAAVKAFGLEERAKNGCITESVQLIGSEGWSKNMFIGLVQRYGIDADVAQQLAENYGDRAWTVCSLIELQQSPSPSPDSKPILVEEDLTSRLDPRYPYILAEVLYAVRHEYAQTATDVLARRTRLAFLNSRAALDSLPSVINVMGDELGWDRKRRKEEAKKTVEFLRSMGLSDAEVEVRSTDVLKLTLSGGLWDGLVSRFGWSTRTNLPGTTSLPSVDRTQSHFSQDEINDLREAFISHASPSYSQSSSESPSLANLRLPKPTLLPTLRSLPTFANTSSTSTITSSSPSQKPSSASQPQVPIRQEDIYYVLSLSGLTEHQEFEFNEFLEICEGLREILFRPSSSEPNGKKSKNGKRRRERMAIPVEKSGGGV